MGRKVPSFAVSKASICIIVLKVKGVSYKQKHLQQTGLHSWRMS